MSRADEIFIQNCKDILENGRMDTDLEVRPRWEDGAPAHTIKKFGIINRYDLSAEFPILTIILCRGGASVIDFCRIFAIEDCGKFFLSNLLNKGEKYDKI